MLSCLLPEKLLKPKFLQPTPILTPREPRPADTPACSSRPTWYKYVSSGQHRNPFFEEFTLETGGGLGLEPR